MKWKCKKPITLKKPVPEVAHNSLFHVLCTNTKFEIQKTIVHKHIYKYAQIHVHTKAHSCKKVKILGNQKTSARKKQGRCFI